MNRAQPTAGQKHFKFNSFWQQAGWLAATKITIFSFNVVIIDLLC